MSRYQNSGPVLNPSDNTVNNDKKNLKSLHMYCKVAWTSSESRLSLEALENGVYDLIKKSEAVQGNYIQAFLRVYRKKFMQEPWQWIDIYEEGVVKKKQLNVDLYKCSTFNTNCSNLLQALNRLIVSKRGKEIRDAGSNDIMVPEYIKQSSLLSFSSPSWLEVKMVLYNNIYLCLFLYMSIC